MSNESHNFEQFMKQREEASRAFVNGDAGPLGRIVTRVSPATFFGPMADYEQGAEQELRHMSAAPHNSSPATRASRCFNGSERRHWLFRSFAESHRSSGRETGSSCVQLTRDRSLPPRRRRVEAGPSSRRLSCVRIMRAEKISRITIRCSRRSPLVRVPDYQRSSRR